MEEKGIVLNIKNSIYTLSPVISEACATCSGGCDKIPVTFTAANPSKLNVKVGSTVSFTTSKRAKSTQGLTAIVLPLLGALTGYCLFSFILPYFLKTTFPEWAKSTAVLVFLFGASFINYIFSAKKQNKPQCIITSVE